MKNKFQSAGYRSVDDLLDQLEGTEKQLTRMLRSLILSALPDLREHLSYNVPFYSRRRRICYIWPSSIPWGGMKPETGVMLGFCQGHLLQHGGYLHQGNRKYVAQRIFSGPEEINDLLIADLLAEACEIDARL